MNQEIYEKLQGDKTRLGLLLRSSLEWFIKYFHWYLYHEEFKIKGFHKEIIEALEDIAFGRNEKRNLAITIPPRFGKTSIAKYACAWSYLLNPKSNCIYTSYSDDLASSFSKDIREILDSNEFYSISGITFKKGKTASEYWMTSAGGGFRAAPLGGGLTGYGCFSYGTKIITEKGNLKIGDIVNKKQKVKIKTIGDNGVQWCYPQKYIYNRNSEFIRIILNDGTIIDCTTDHKFYTNKGILRGDELTVDSVFPSNSCNNIRFYEKFFHYFFNRIIFIADKISLRFCGKVFINRGLFDFNNKSNRLTSPLSSSLNIRHLGETYSIISRYFFIASRVLRNFSRYIGVNFTVSIMRSMFNRILFIIGLCPVCKILCRVIKRIAVKMTNNHSYGPRMYKSFRNKMMNTFTFTSQTNNKIPFLGFPWFKNIRFFSKNTSNSSHRRDFVFSLPFIDRKPSFIYKIGYYPSYCVNICPNHNLFLAGHQQVLVKNCGVSGEEFGGFGLIDDSLKPSLVKSPTEIQNVIDIYENTLKSRANNKRKTPFVLIMQRVAVDDLVGYVTENEPDDWKIIKIPALNEETGVALWEEKYPASELLKLKKNVPFVYYSQYQQEPIILGGSVFKTEWFRYYSVFEPYYYQSAYITSDTAMKTGEANDYTVISLWGKTIDNKLHLIDMVRGKFEAPDLKKQVILFWEKWKDGIGENKCPPYGFYIEDKSSGIGLMQDIRRTCPIPIIPINRSRFKEYGIVQKQDKYSRALSAIPYITNGWVYLPNSEKDDISVQVLNEAAAFRADLSHKHDDMCLSGDTLISTIWGKKKIKDIKKGEYVITPYGLRKVLKSECTGIKKVIDKNGIIGTPDHKIYTQKRFEQLDNVNDASVCDILSLKGLILWKYKRLSILMEKNINSWEGRESIICLNQQKTLKDGMLKDFMSLFGNFIREKKFRKAMLFTIKTIILLITTFLTWSVYQSSNIWLYMQKTVYIGSIAMAVKNIWKKSDPLQNYGILPKRAESGIANILTKSLINYDKQKFAQTAAENLKRVPKLKPSAENVGTLNTIEKQEDVRKVYNLTIDKTGVYYANDVLVSNCDCLVDAVDIAFGRGGVGSIFI